MFNTWSAISARVATQMSGEFGSFFIRASAAEALGAKR